MTNKDAVIKMYESIPDKLKDTFIDMCNDADKAVLTDYLSVLGQEQVLLDKEKVFAVSNTTISEMSKIGRLCEYGLESESKFSFWMSSDEVDYKMLNTLSVALENKTDNPISKEVKSLVDGIKNVFLSGANLSESFKEIGELYEKFKDNLSGIPFEENKISYIETGVRLTVGNYDLNNFDKVDTRFMFPILLAEAYRNIDPDRYRDNDERGGFLYPKDICSRADYLEIQSKVELFSNQETLNEIEKNLDVTKYDKIKYELDNQEVEKLEMKDNISNDSKFENEMNNAIENDSANENNCDETLENEIDNLEDNNNDDYDSYESCE